MAVFELHIVTPDGECYAGESEKLIVRTIDGDVCILSRHIDYLTALSSGEARVVVNGKVRRAACSGGMLGVSSNVVRLVATTFEWEENIDRERAEKAKEDAEKRISQAKDDSELELAKAKLSRALTRIKVVSK